MVKDIQRKPHPVFAAIWLVWYANVLGALLTPAKPFYSLIVLLSFVPIEAIAIWRETWSRDQLSEIATWLIRRFSKTRDLARGWNAALLMIVLTIAYVFGRMVYSYTGFWPLAVVLSGLMIVWLYDHWTSPDIHG